MGTWNYYVLTYIYSDTNANIQVYINGVPRPDSEKRTTTYDHNGMEYHGKLHIGHHYVNLDANGYQVSNIQMDETAIWEHMLPYCDITRLYNAYMQMLE